MNKMYPEHPALAFSRLLVCIRKARKIIKSDEYRLSDVEFQSCGGKKEKTGGLDYSYRRQLVYAERSLRKMIKGDMSMFDDSKTPGKKQVVDMMRIIHAILDDTNDSCKGTTWSDSDNEDVDDFDGEDDDEEEEDEEEGAEEDAEEEDDDEDDTGETGAKNEDEEDDDEEYNDEDAEQESEYEDGEDEEDGTDEEDSDAGENDEEGDDDDEGDNGRNALACM